MIRNSANSEWRNVAAWDSDDALTSGPVSFTLDGKSLYLTDSRDSNAGKLTLLNLETGESKILAEDPQYDVGSVMLNPDTYELEAVSFNRARNEWQVISPKVEQDFAVLREVHPGDFAVTSRDHADKTWLVAYMADNGPVSYYSYNRDTKQATFLFVNYPALSNYTLAEISPISFTARDGLTIHGYITFPPLSEHKNLPMVLNVHGGPWGRDTWGYNPEVQWFANRGYTCLQVNFRGSTGYGKNFVNAGDREWAGNMHNDLVDAVEWAVQQGYADPKRVAIYGGSYGGYAALVGATFTPDLFSCAVDIVGPSSLITLIKSIPPYWATFFNVLLKRVGNPDTDEEFLKSRSPLYKVDNIKIPMLIAQGANDPRVKQAEAEQVVEAMKSKGIDYEYMLFPDEGHGFAKPDNRLKFYAAAEKFLAKHLGGRYEE
jgi:dipeptidyl aminopeptidase/acylaminoacyl peptidase